MNHYDDEEWVQVEENSAVHDWVEVTYVNGRPITSSQNGNTSLMCERNDLKAGVSECAASTLEEQHLLSSMIVTTSISSAMR